MKKLLLLATIFCFTAPLWAQGGKAVKPVLKSLGTGAIQEARQNYLQELKAFNRLTPPLVSSSYALKVGKKMGQDPRLSQSISKYINTRVEKLEAQNVKRLEALEQYGKALAEENPLLSAQERIPSPLPDVYNATSRNHFLLPFENYMRAVSRSSQSAGFEKLPLEQKAIALFLQKDLAQASAKLADLFEKDPTSDDLRKLSFSCANKLAKTVRFMLQYPNAFRPELFKLTVYLASSPSTPFSDYLRAILKKDPNHLSYQAWVRAERTGINFTPYEQFYQSLRKLK